MRVRCEGGLAYDYQPAHTGLISIDFQEDFIGRGFCLDRGYDVPNLRKALGPAQKALEIARSAGMTVIHTREGYAPDLRDLNPFRRRSDTMIGERGPLGRFLIRGEAGHEIVPEMAPIAGELTIDKAAFSAFYGTGLAKILRDLAIDHVILMGVTTQCCVASTLRSAVDEGFHPLLLQDCCAAFSDADHEASISVISSENNTFGWVSDVARFLESVANSSGSAAPFVSE
jgi:nicotinamidase-related amidase